MFYRYLVALLSILVCFSVSRVCFAQDDDEFENLVRNPDFEDFGIAPWTMWVEDAGAVAQMIIDDEESFTGDQSLLIDIAQKGGGQRVELHQKPFNLKNGQKLTYALWAKTEEGEVRPAKMVVNHRAAPWTSYASKAITITEEWTEFWTPVVMTANDALVGIYVEMKDTEGLTWFDRFRLYEGDYFQEDLDGIPRIAVESSGKLSATWAAVKSGQR